MVKVVLPLDDIRQNVALVSYFLREYLACAWVVVKALYSWHIDEEVVLEVGVVILLIHKNMFAFWNFGVAQDLEMVL